MLAIQKQMIYTYLCKRYEIKNEVPKMKKANKKQIAKMVKEIYNIEMRFATTEDSQAGGPVVGANGAYDTRKKEIVVKQNSVVSTLAHEIAHAIQFDVMGATDCDSTRYSKKHNSELSKQHAMIQKNVEIQLTNNGIEEAWNTATDTYPRITKSNIGKEQLVIAR